MRRYKAATRQDKPTRTETMKYKRIVFKVGTSSITRSDGSLSRGKIQT
ncbi:TPA: glutamate 5-kinase, partial [Neisseria gonorrhoeae]